MLPWKSLCLATAALTVVGASACSEAKSGSTSAGSHAGGGIAGADSSVAGGGSDGAPANCSAVLPPRGWANWLMPNPGPSGLPNPASVSVSESGNLVTDDVTGLVWQRYFDSRLFTWDDAKHYCACLELDGTRGWQLPARVELASLVDWTRASPSIDATAFPSTPNENFWTSSPVTTSPGLAYLVFFLNGHTTYSDVTYEYRARCVQPSATAAPEERYRVADGAVYDTQTQLTWQQVIPPARYGWADAEAYCAELSLGDNAGDSWRLPSINELQTLVDDTTNPAIDLVAFPKTPSEYFWSSSMVIDDPTRAWTAFFTNGSTYSFALTASKNVRCVR